MICIWLDCRPFATMAFIDKLISIYGKKIIIFIPKRFENQSKRSGIDVNEKSDYFYFYDTYDEIIKKNIITEKSINIVNGFNKSLIYFLKENNAGKIIVLSEHRNSSYFKEPIRNILVYFKYKFFMKLPFEGVLAIGKGAYKFYKKTLKHKLILLTYYSPRITKPCQIVRNTPDCGAPYLYIGRNEYKGKGIDKLLRFFTKHNELNLVIIGDYGKQADIVKKTALKYKNINVIPAMKINEVEEFVNQNDFKAMLIPSSGEGCNPNAILSLSFGLPCITTKTSGTHEIIEKFNNGLVSKDSTRSFAKQILKFESEYKQKFVLYSNNSCKAFENEYLNLLIGDIYEYIEKNND